MHCMQAGGQTGRQVNCSTPHTYGGKKSTKERQYCWRWRLINYGISSKKPRRSTKREKESVCSKRIVVTIIANVLSPCVPTLHVLSATLIAAILYNHNPVLKLFLAKVVRGQHNKSTNKAYIYLPNIYIHGKIIIIICFPLYFRFLGVHNK